MFLLISVAVLSFNVGMLVNRVLSRKANALILETARKHIEDKAFHEGFDTGWKHASMDWTNVRTCYEKFMRPNNEK